MKSDCSPIHNLYLDLCNHYDLRSWATMIHSVIDHLRFNDSINHVTCSNDIDRCLADFSSIIDKAIPATCKNTITPCTIYSGSINNPEGNKWFTNECFEKRRTFYSALDVYRHENPGFKQI